MYRDALHPPPLPPGFLTAAALVLAAWLVAVLTLGSAGSFHAPPDTPPPAMLTAIAGPPLLFLALLNIVPTFHRRILAIDPVWLAAVQGLRVVGAGFLFVHAFGHLPSLVAHPAGWGDVLVGLLAPFVAVRLARDPSFLTSPWLCRFHALGMLDFVGAVGSGLLARGAVPGVVDGVTTSAPGDLPLVLIPGFAVPLWICLRIAAFAQIRAARRGDRVWSPRSRGGAG